MKLVEGNNVLFVRVHQLTGGWLSATRLLTRDGGPLRGLSYW